VQLISTCPLCHSPSAEDFHTDKLRRYFRCKQCALVFTDPATLLLPAEEKAIYDHHENSVARYTLIVIFSIAWPNRWPNAWAINLCRASTLAAGLAPH
jgi:hypothetical protein